MREHVQIKHLRDLKLKQQVLGRFRKFRLKQLKLHRIESKLTVLKNKWLIILALRNWQLFTCKRLSYKQDPILCQFMDLDNAIIL